MIRGSKEFYDELHKIHNEAFPDWRFGQLIFNFLSWYGQDPFYLEDDRIIHLIKKFANDISMFHKYPEVND